MSEAQHGDGKDEDEEVHASAGRGDDEAAIGRHPTQWSIEHEWLAAQPPHHGGRWVENPGQISHRGPTVMRLETDGGERCRQVQHPRTAQLLTNGAILHRPSPFGSGRESDYERSHPTRALLVVEVADTSLAQDRHTKVPIYAAGSVTEVWIVDLRNDRIEVHRKPDPAERRYRSVTTVSRRGQVTLVSFPGSRVRASDLLPARA